MGNTRAKMRVVSLKLPAELDYELTRIAREKSSSRSAVFREALESYARSTTKRSAASVAKHLAGSVRGPRDLTTNPKHLKGYGE
jgi:predicted transcriptional regulator